MEMQVALVVPGHQVLEGLVVGFACNPQVNRPKGSENGQPSSENPDRLSAILLKRRAAVSGCPLVAVQGNVEARSLYNLEGVAKH